MMRASAMFNYKGHNLAKIVKETKDVDKDLEAENERLKNKIKTLN